MITCDIGDRFEIWTGFSGDYGGYGAKQEILLADLVKEDVFGLFVDIFTDPQKRNPEKIAAKVTREVAADLAELAKSLESPHPQPLSRRRGEPIQVMFPFSDGRRGTEVLLPLLRERAGVRAALSLIKSVYLMRFSGT